MCGVVHVVNECNTIIAKQSQREMVKRDVEVVDDTGMSVRLTLWGDEVRYYYPLLYLIIIDPMMNFVLLLVRSFDLLSE